jgi:hypothetical protein
MAKVHPRSVDPMATKKKAPEPDMLTTAAQAIGSTLGKLAIAAGIEHPAAPVVKKEPTTAMKKTPAKKGALKKGVVKKTAAASAKVRTAKAKVAKKKGGT